MSAGNMLESFLRLVQECLHHVVRIQGDETALKNTWEYESVPSSRTARCNVFQNKRRSRAAPIKGIASETAPQPRQRSKTAQALLCAAPSGERKRAMLLKSLKEHPIRGFHKGVSPLVPEGGSIRRGFRSNPRLVTKNFCDKETNFSKERKGTRQPPPRKGTVPRENFFIKLTAVCCNIGRKVIQYSKGR